MGKSKKPRKPESPTADESARSDEELELTTPPPPPREPVPLPLRRSPLPARRTPAPSRPVLYDLLQTIRTAVGAMLDIADAAAEAITRTLEGHA